jgi:hypothetical protein
MVMAPFTRTAWNAIIDQINAKITSCEASVTPIPEVNPDHIWTVDDVALVRTTLSALCTGSTFTTTLRLWAQDVINEINTVLANCNCSECEQFVGSSVTAAESQTTYVNPAYPEDMEPICCVGGIMTLSEITYTTQWSISLPFNAVVSVDGSRTSILKNTPTTVKTSSYTITTTAVVAWDNVGGECENCRQGDTFTTPTPAPVPAPICIITSCP